MNKTSLFARLFSLISFIILIFASGLMTPALAYASTAASVGSPYLYNFNSPGTLDETGSATQSTSPYWWVNSGGQMLITNGTGGTIQGDLSSLSPWHIVYAANNP